MIENALDSLIELSANVARNLLSSVITMCSLIVLEVLGFTKIQTVYMKNNGQHTEGWERVMAVMNHYGLNKNSFSVKIGMSNSMTIGRIINEKRKPIQATLNKIADNCPEINRDWLLTGEGEMLKSKPSIVDTVEGVPHVMIRDDAWQVIKDQAASLRTKDEQMAEVIALLKEQIKKGESLAGGQSHVAQGEAALG